MSIVENRFNPVPLHTSTDDWWDNRKTFKGEHSHIYAPRGVILPFQITGNSNWLPSSNSIVISGLTSTYAQYNGTYRAYFTYDDSTAMITFANTSTATMYLVVTRESANVYSMYLTPDGGSTQVALGYKTLSNVYSTFNKNTLYTLENFVIASNSMAVGFDGSVWCASLTLSAAKFQLVCCTTETTYNLGATVYVELVPAAYATSTRKCVVAFPSRTVTQTRAIGTYYLKIADPTEGTIYYSEPFEWRDVSDMIHIKYRSTMPLVTGTDYVPFTNRGVAMYFDMYLDSYEMMPPYYFNEEMEENDGVKFVSKRVSYRNHKFSLYMCTGYFAEALRLLWHCDNISINGETVDYLDAPEPDWGNDNHFCSVNIEYQTDTIVQSNGVAVTPTQLSEGTTFNSSYNESFN